MAKLVVNQVTLCGRLVRADYRKGMSKAGKPFLSASLTLDVEGNQIKAESFSMQYKADGETESTNYTGLMTIFNEANALHKTMKEVGEDKADEVEVGIVEDINDCTAIKCSNWNGFKYCRMVENSYAKDGNIVKNTRVEFAYANRVDENKTEYKAQRDFEICGAVKVPPMVMEDMDGNEYCQMTVVVPNYVDAYGERKASVTLNEVVVQSHDTSVFGYLEDNFEVNSFVYLNGEFVRTVERFEVEAPMDNEGRGFGRQVKHQANYQTKVTEYMEILGGYVLEQDEVEEEPAFDMNLWEEAMKVKKEKEEEMLNGGNEEKPKQGFGRGGSEVKKPKLPF
jgi:hypothetical protein